MWPNCCSLSVSSVISRLPSGMTMTKSKMCVKLIAARMSTVPHSDRDNFGAGGIDSSVNVGTLKDTEWERRSCMHGFTSTCFWTDSRLLSSCPCSVRSRYIFLGTLQGPAREPLLMHWRLASPSPLRWDCSGIRKASARFPRFSKRVPQSDADGTGGGFLFFF